jgi:hypothetical protein
MDAMRVELVGAPDGPPVLVFSITDRGHVMAVSDREFLRALRAIIANAKRFPESRLADIVLPAEH